MRAAIDEAYDDMCEYDSGEEKYVMLEDFQNKLVNAWSTNLGGGLSKHKHSWRLPEDDD